MSKVTQLVAPDAISQTLEKYQPPQLLEVIRGLKPLMAQNPAQAREVLEKNQDLTFAIVQSMLLMGLVDEHVVQSVMQNATPAPAPAAAPAPAKQSLEDRLNALPAEQATMIRQVLALTEEQVQMLPADQQTYIRTIKNTYS